MKAYECDACGALYSPFDLTDRTNYGDGVYNKITIRLTRITLPEVEYDLCKKCVLRRLQPILRRLEVHNG